MPVASSIQLSPGVPLARGIRQAALTCLDEALWFGSRISTDPVPSIHETRIRLKQLRALVRLIPRPRPWWLKKTRREATACAQRLGPVRDRVVTAAVCADILTRHPRRWQPVLGRLVRRTPARSAIPSPARCAELLERFALMRSRLAARSWPPLGNVPLRDSLRRAYRRARRAHACVEFRPTAVIVHEWRKATVLLRNQLDSVAPSLAGPTRKFRRRLHELTGWLGTIGDLTLAERRIDALRVAPRDRVAQKEVLAWISRRRRQLLARSLRGSAALFRVSPREFVARLADRR